MASAGVAGKALMPWIVLTFRLTLVWRASPSHPPSSSRAHRRNRRANNAWQAAIFIGYRAYAPLA
jgi:hypothetical protein